MAKRISGELPGYAASAQCAAVRLVEALDKAKYPHMDLIALFNSQRIALFERRDRNEVDQAYTARAQSRLIEEFVASEHFRDELGITPARNRACTINDLRPECTHDRSKTATILTQDYLDSFKGPFFLDWSLATRRCFVVTKKPTDRTIMGGGPFETFSEALAAAQTVMGCQPPRQR
jgi:hypothetical protein